MVTARDAQLSLADQAVRDSVRSLVEKHMQHAAHRPGSRYGRATKTGVSDGRRTVHDDGRKVNVKLIVIGLLAAILVLFALLEHPRGRGRLASSTPVSAPMILVIAMSAVDRVRDGIPRARVTWRTATTDRQLSSGPRRARPRDRARRG